MNPTVSSPSSAARRAGRRTTGVRPRSDRARSRQAPGKEPRVLGRYSDWQGRPREVVAQAGSGGSVLVVDRELAGHGDRRLLAHLGPDEPVKNAALVCESYLREARNGRPCCRALTDEDYRSEPFANGQEGPAGAPSLEVRRELVDGDGRVFRLEFLHTGMSIPELRWRQHPSPEGQARADPVSLREVVACLQDYEPACTATIRALARHHGDGEVSTTVLRAELQRVKDSPIVLNRRLRDVALSTIERQGLSMSEIAIRCGRVKRDCRGNESGETSWLARRLGILPEGGRTAPTPWVHSDVLALIARCGLGVSPREVELG